MGITITHHELTVAFGVLGNITSFTVFLAPVPTFYRIWKKKSTESFQCLPYQVALFSCMLGLYYALLRRNAMLLVTVNTFGCIVEAAYIILFIAFATSSNRNSTIKVFVLLDVGAFSAILLLTHYLHIEEHTRVVILGWISVGFNILVFAAPLSIVAHVIRTKSVEFMPFTLSFYLTLSAVMWFEYGLFLKDIYIALPNILGFVLGMVQMLLYAIFRNSSKKKAIEDKKLADQELKSVVVIRNSEVHPFETEVANEDEQNREQNQTDKGEEEEEEQPPQEKKTVTSSEVSSEVIQQNDSPPV